MLLFDYQCVVAVWIRAKTWVKDWHAIPSVRIHCTYTPLDNEDMFSNGLTQWDWQVLDMLYADVLDSAGKGGVYQQISLYNITQHPTPHQSSYR